MIRFVDADLNCPIIDPKEFGCNVFDVVVVETTLVETTRRVVSTDDSSLITIIPCTWLGIHPVR